MNTKKNIVNTVNTVTNLNTALMSGAPHLSKRRLVAQGHKRATAARAAGALIAHASVLALSGYGALAYAQAVSQTGAANAVVAGSALAAAPRQVLHRELGRIWLTEDPVLLKADLNVSAAGQVVVRNGLIQEAVRFSAYSNYSAFIDKAQLMIYAPQDSERTKPLVTLDVALGAKRLGVNQVSVEWDGKVPGAQALRLREGDQLQYVLRVSDSAGRWDETVPAYIKLVSNVERERALEQLKANADLGAQLRSKEAGLSLEQYSVSTGIYGNSRLAVQNIVLAGSQVRLRGQAIPEGMVLTINGQSVSIDAERKFVTEYLLPVGQYRFDLEAKNAQGQVLQSSLDASVRGEYWFMVALADLTHSHNSYSGQVQAVREEDYKRFDGQHTQGRLAFYLKGKIQGRYLLTAHADTLERDTSDLFKNLFKADRTDVLRRIDPDAYYPIYGDDSTANRDVDTSGRLYVRLDWDKSSALWGNIATEFDSSSLAAYNRKLYGVKIGYRSTDTTALGAPQTQVQGFLAEQQTAPGRSELLGTGGSLYFMRHTDIVPGSETVKLEVRDKDSARVTASYDLKPGRDFELDAFQGRLILTRPLLQISRDNALGQSIADQPQDGAKNVLVVSYEYYPRDILQGNFSAGVNVRQWVSQNVAVGGSYAKEERSGKDYELKGVELTMQKSQGTWFKIEHAQSQSSAAPIAYSSDGGLSFTQLATSASGQTNSLDRFEGNATAVEARLNGKELGLSDSTWKAAAWWRDKNAGFSGQHSTALGKDQTDVGIEVIGQVNPDLQWLVGSKRVTTSQAPSTGLVASTNELTRSQIGLRWQAQNDLSVLGEVQQVTQEITGKSDASAGLVALNVSKSLGDKWDVYAGAQTAFSQNNYQDNTSATVGTRYAFDNGSSIALEYTDGDRGSALTASSEYKRTNEHSIYSSYTFAPRTSAPTDGESLIASRTFSKYSGWILGQRLQLGQQWRLVNESQWLSENTTDGQLNSLGLEFMPKTGWNIGLSLQKGDVNNNETGQINERQAQSLSGAYTDSRMSWSSKLEYRQDRTNPAKDLISGAITTASTSNGEQTQWLSTNRLNYKVSDDWRMLGKINYSLTRSGAAGQAQMKDAYLRDSSVGFAWRPRQGKLNLLAKYNYMYDLAPLSQINTIGSQFDQKSKVASVEATYELSPEWEVAAKLAHRKTSMRLERGRGLWFSNDALYAAGQVRWHIGDHGLEQGGNARDLFQGWSVMAEYRMLSVQQDGDKKGALLSLDKDFNKNLRLNLGYNFTDFSADLSQLTYKHKGWFVNLVARY